MAKTIEEQLTAATTKATKAETKRIVNIVKTLVGDAAELQTDKVAVKTIKALGKDLVAAIK